MALQVDEIKSTLSRFHQDSASLHRPMMLKDFLRDDSYHSRTPSSYGFPMYPCKSTAVVSSQSNKPSIVLLRSLSKKAAATKISAVHKVIKLHQFASLKSPSVLPRSFSRKLTRRSENKNDIFGGAPEVKVKVKDILRWTSFRDTVEDNSTQLDFPSSPNRSTTDTSSSCSKRSSWCDSDFTAEELAPWGGHENKEFWDNNSKDEWSLEEYEQQSPVSVLDSPFTEVVQDFISPSHPILSNIQRAKCYFTRRIQELNSQGKIMIVSEEVNAAEEKARKLLSHVKEDSKSNVHDHQVVLDFFMDELTINGKLHDHEFDCKILSIARSWMDGEFDESYEWEVEERRESYVREMEKERCWNKFKQEQEQMSKELEIELFDDLVHDILADFLAR